MLRVLVGCEFSGTVRDAFAARGHFARSVDLLPTESLPEPVMFRGDFGCYDHVSFTPTCDVCVHDEPWCHIHEMFAYECTCLGPTEDEAEYADSCEHGARHLSGDIFTVEDIPHWFGEPAFKATGFELIGLPPLVPTKRLTPPKAGTPEHKQWSKVHLASPGPNRWKERSKFFKGIADAMADQWGALPMQRAA